MSIVVGEFIDGLQVWLMLGVWVKMSHVLLRTATNTAGSNIKTELSNDCPETWIHPPLILILGPNT